MWIFYGQADCKGGEQPFKVPGRGPPPQGHLLQDRPGKVQMVVTEDADIIARSGKKCQRK